MLRSGRLYPLHALILLCFVSYELTWWLRLSRYSPELRPAFSGSTSSQALLSNFLLLNSFGLLDGTSWNYPAWSIGAEFWTYILFAVLITCTPSVIFAQCYARSARSHCYSAYGWAILESSPRTQLDFRDAYLGLPSGRYSVVQK